jgi:hypothetical protein
MRKQLHKLRSTAREYEGLGLTIPSLVYLGNYLVFSDLRKLIAKIGALLVT